MPRKKVSDDVIDAVNLADDEEIIVNEERRIGKRKRAKEPEPPEVEILDDDDVEIVENDDFPEGTIGAILNRSEDEQFRDQQATILVVRHPDSAGEKFTNPCTSRLNLQPIRNVELNRPVDEIEDLIRTTYGGGHYYLQIRVGNSIQSGFKVDIADPPQVATPPKAIELPAPAPAQPPAPPANPIAEMLSSLTQLKALKDALFGEQEAALKERIDKLETELRDARNNQPKPEPQSETVMILEKALAAGNPDITDRLLEYAFPAADSGKHWIADLFKTAIEHKEEIAGVLASVAGGPRQLPAGGVTSILQKQPPAGAIPQSNFKRKDTTTTPASENGSDADAGRPKTSEKEAGKK